MYHNSSTSSFIISMLHCLTKAAVPSQVPIWGKHSIQYHILESQMGQYLRTDNMKTSLISHALVFLCELSKKSQVTRQHPPSIQLIINPSSFSIRCFHSGSSSLGSTEKKKVGKGSIKVLEATQQVQGSVCSSRWRFPHSLISKQSQVGLRRRMTGCNRWGHGDDYHPRHLLIQSVLTVITDTNHFSLPSVCLTALAVKYFYMALCIFTRICRGCLHGPAVVWKWSFLKNK